MQFWKPGEAFPATAISSSDKDQRKNTTVMESTSLKKQQDNLKLSKSVLNMRFMQRQDESKELSSKNDMSTSFKNSSADFRKRRILVVGDEQKEIEWIRDDSNVFSTLPGRRSFGGCNKFIEREYSKALDQTYSEKLSIKRQSDSVTDEEMLERYEKLIGLPRGPNQGMRPKNATKLAASESMKSINKRKVTPNEDMSNFKRQR